MAVDAATRPAFSTGAPKLLLKTAFFARDGALDYDVSRTASAFSWSSRSGMPRSNCTSSSAGSTS